MAFLLSGILRRQFIIASRKTQLEEVSMQCPACHLEIPEDVRFRSGYGREIDRKGDISKSPGLEGERKHATILFSDLSGYTALSERLDPEEVKNC